MLIERHETGGDTAADLLQAADSLSFLEVNAGRARSWVEEGRCDLASGPGQARLDAGSDPRGRGGGRGPGLHRRATAALSG